MNCVLTHFEMQRIKSSCVEAYAFMCFLRVSIRSKGCATVRNKYRIFMEHSNDLENSKVLRATSLDQFMNIRGLKLCKLFLKPF